MKKRGELLVLHVPSEWVCSHIIDLRKLYLAVTDILVRLLIQSIDLIVRQDTLLDE
jgi:hypothetical protein